MEDWEIGGLGPFLTIFDSFCPSFIAFLSISYCFDCFVYCYWLFRPYWPFWPYIIHIREGRLLAVCVIFLFYLHFLFFFKLKWVFQFNVPTKALLEELNKNLTLILVQWQIIIFNLTFVNYHIIFLTSLRLIIISFWWRIPLNGASFCRLSINRKNNKYRKEKWTFWVWH